MKSMKKVIILIFVLVIVIGGGVWWLVNKNFQRIRYAPQFPNPDVSNPDFFAIFEGRTPCTTDEILRGCEKIKLRLTLFKNPQADKPTTYKLGYFGIGNDWHTTEGKLNIIPDKKTIPGTDIYVLDEKTPTEYRWWLTVGKNILLELDENQNIKVGDAGWSYTLSRTR